MKALHWTLNLTQLGFNIRDNVGGECAPPPTTRSSSRPLIQGLQFTKDCFACAFPVAAVQEAVKKEDQKLYFVC